MDIVGIINQTRSKSLLEFSELRKPINIPIGLTIAEGNLNDQKHFQMTFDQIKVQ